MDRAIKKAQPYFLIALPLPMSAKVFATATLFMK